jgi:hypothetical protein
VTALQAVADTPSWLSGWVGVAVAVLGALGLLASAAAYLRASYAKATVATLAESNAALSEQVRILKDERDAERQEREAERARLAREAEQVAVRVEALERENGTLREVVQGKADIERVIMVITDHHHEVIEDRRAFHVEWRGEIEKIQATMDDALTAVGEVATSQRAVRGMVGKVYAATVGERT